MLTLCRYVARDGRRARITVSTPRCRMRRPASRSRNPRAGNHRPPRWSAGAPRPRKRHNDCRRPRHNSLYHPDSATNRARRPVMAAGRRGRATTRRPARSRSPAIPARRSWGSHTSPPRRPTAAPPPANRCCTQTPRKRGRSGRRPRDRRTSDTRSCEGRSVGSRPRTRLGPRPQFARCPPHRPRTAGPRAAGHR